jgi:hypothetical protein
MKELLKVEFRYNDKKQDRNDYDCVRKTVTIGIYDTIEEAVAKGNEVIKELSKTFEVRHGDKFEVNGLWGYPKRLVTNVSYPTKGVQYFAKIVHLDFSNINNVVDEAMKASKRYHEFRKRQDENEYL